MPYNKLIHWEVPLKGRRQNIHLVTALLYHKLAVTSDEQCTFFGLTFLPSKMRDHWLRSEAFRLFLTLKNSKKRVLHSNPQYSFTQLRKKCSRILTMYSAIICSISVFWNAGFDPLKLIFQFSKRLQLTI